MEYAVGRCGRIIAARLFEGEQLYESIESIAEKEKIKSAAVLITGGIRKAEVVVGPRTETPKIEPEFLSFTGPGEVLGVGTIYCDEEDKPKLHLHAGIGKGDKPIVGCPRGREGMPYGSGASIFLILEVTIIEIAGIAGKRETDPVSGFKLLRIKK